MALSGVNQTISDNALGASGDKLDNVGLLIGYSTAGTANTVYSFTDPAAAKSTLVSGPLCEAAVYYCNQGAQVFCVPVASDVAGSAGSVTKSGTGPEITVTGTPKDAYRVKVKITKAGAVATSEFQYSLDDGANWSPVLATAATYIIPDTGLTLAFAVGTYVKDETYSFACVAPGYTTTAYGTAFDAFMAMPYAASLHHVVGTPTDAAATATLVAAVQTKLAAAAVQYRYMRGFVEAAEGTDSALVTAMASVSADRVVLCPGFVTLTSSVTLRSDKRSAAWPAMARALKNKPQRHLGAVADKGLASVTALSRDERTATTALNDQRMLTLRTRIGRAGFFVEQPWTLATRPSDFASLHNCRVVDKACAIAYSASLEYVNRDFDLNANGTLAEHEAAGFESYVLAALNVLVAEGNASGVQFLVSRTDDILSTETIHVKVRVQPKGYARFIESDIGLTKTLPQAA